jgi:hypothetical protein
MKPFITYCTFDHEICFFCTTIAVLFKEVCFTDLSFVKFPLEFSNVNVWFNTKKNKFSIRFDVLLLVKINISQSSKQITIDKPNHPKPPPTQEIMKLVVYVDADMSYAAVDQAFEAAEKFAKNEDGRVLLVDFDGTQSLTSLVSYKIESNKTPDSVSNPSLDNSGLRDGKTKRIYKNLELYICSGARVSWDSYDMKSSLQANIINWKKSFDSVILYMPFSHIYFEDFWKLLRKESNEMFQVVSEGNSSRILNSKLPQIVRKMD